MSEATVLVHPTVGLGDAVPTVIKEAMAARTPVIASRAVGIPELLDDGRCGLLVPPEDVSALAEAIDRLIGDPEQRSRFTQAGREFAECKFDMWRNGRRLADLLRSADGEGIHHGGTEGTEGEES
jgi:glycosyltransferase involved in cell wall biosynthesis